MEHVHDQMRDPHTRQIFIQCYCFCGDCFSLADNGESECVCPECFCRDVDLSKRRLPAEYYRDHAEVPKRPVENVVGDLPEVLPGKTGQCRTCGGPTYRQGTRGRFPVTCEGCK